MSDEKPIPLRARLKGSFAHAPRTLALVWRSSKPATLALLGLTLTSAAFPLAVAWVGKAIVDAVVARSPALALRWVAVELAVVAGQAASQRGLSLVRTLLGARLSIDINTTILEKALTLDLAHFEDAEFYDKLTRARREASSRPVSMVTGSFQLLQNVLTLGGYAALLVGFSGWAVLGLLIASVPATIGEIKFSNQAYRLRNWRSPEWRRLNYYEYLLANDDHAKEVKIYRLGPMMLARYRELGERIYGEDKQLSIKRSSYGYLLSLIGTAAFYGCYVFMAIGAAKGALTLGALTLYIVAFRQGQQAFQSILGAIGGMYEDNLYMSNLFDFLGIETQASSKHANGSAPAPIEAEPFGSQRGLEAGTERSAAERPSRGSERGRELVREPGAGDARRPPSLARSASVNEREQGVRFEAVGFKYPGQDKWALRNLDVFIPKGQSLALVGHNGAGKTTFIKLLSRLYEPTEGRVLLDGKNLREIDPEALRARVGVVFQDFAQYQLLLRENVGVGSVDHLDEGDRIDRAIDMGGAKEVVSATPKGLETPLGKWFKDGVELSGGQWQKVALARAFMREEADILVLDEPTAALDPEAEHAIFERFRALAQGRTTILISHRFPTVRMADRIVVLDGGKIIESGSHGELVAEGGTYARLFKLQAEGYA